MTRRRQAAEGGISAYQTKAGLRYRVDFSMLDDYGKPKRQTKGGFLTKKAAGESLLDLRTQVKAGRYVKKTSQTVGQYMTEWLDGLRLGPTTVGVYRRLNRLHVEPYLGKLGLQELTSGRLSKHYRELERSGWKGRGERTGLGLNTVTKVHSLLSGALAKAVADGILAINPAAKADPPTAAEARPGEMQVWSPAQIRFFLGWAEENKAEWFPIWHLLFSTGARRGEVMGIQWKDVDLAAGTLAIRRSINVLSEVGKRRQILVGPPKNRRARNVALDTRTVAVLRAYRRERGDMSLTLVAGDRYVFGDLSGGFRDPNNVTEAFARHIRLATTPGVDHPRIRVHDARHSHATALLLAGTPVQVAAERIGDDPGTMLRVYAHVLPGQQRAAAEAVATLFS